jgi:GT2 family glycosyltransferase/glycosyltransferase involved in cell wall biosynthesis
VSALSTQSSVRNLFPRHRQSGGVPRSIDVIIPVYDGLNETRACIESALETIDFAHARLIIINDDSPNEELCAWLRSLPASDDLILLENESNLGFVETVNRGMTCSDENDVLLLNSDVVVANNWLERLQKTAYAQANIGTVTPFSNNATICSFPNFCEENELLFGLSVETIDAAFSGMEADQRIELPTGVGCCIFIRRQCIDEVGLFDVESFGRGYGEENDFCLRATADGWIHALGADVFVHHLGGVSFGSEKDLRVQEAIAKLNELYPGYDALIQQHINEDPAAARRMEALSTLFTSSQKKKILLLSHNLGGGVSRHTTELSDYLFESALFLLLQPREGQRVDLHFLAGGKRLTDRFTIDLARDYDDLVQLLKDMGISFVHFHHIMGLPEKAWALSDDLDCSFDVTLHDYYLINSSPTHADENGVYQEDERLVDFHLPEGLSLSRWRNAQWTFLERAASIIAPSSATRDIYHRYFPNLEIQVACHPDRFTESEYTVCPRRLHTGAFRIGVVGAISLEKGADWLERVALAARHRGLDIEFVLIGFAYRPLKGLAHTTGPYEEAEVKAISEKAEIDTWWFPALWPETYSYTLSFALQTGLPIVATRIGAFTERLRGRPLTKLLSRRDIDEPLEAFASLRAQLNNATEYSQVWTSPPPLNFYRTQYLNGLVPRKTAVSINRELIRRLFDSRAYRHKPFNEQLVILLFGFANMRGLGLISRAIPARLKNSIKQKLSHKSIADILESLDPKTDDDKAIAEHSVVLLAELEDMPVLGPVSRAISAPLRRRINQKRSHKPEDA